MGASAEVSSVGAADVFSVEAAGAGECNKKLASTSVLKLAALPQKEQCCLTTHECKFLTRDQCLLHRTFLYIAWPFWSSFLLVCFVRLWHLQGIFNELFTNYNNKLQAMVTTGLGQRND